MTPSHNMEKRLFIALALSLLILLVWTTLMPKPTPAPINPPSNPLMSGTSIQSNYSPAAAQSVIVPKPHAAISLSQQNRIIRIIEPQAAIDEVIFSDYQSSKFIITNSLLYNEPGLIFKKDYEAGNTMIFSASDNSKRVTKRFDFHNSNYTIELEIQVKNNLSNPLVTKIPIVLGLLNFAGDQNEARFQDITVSADTKILHPNPRKDSKIENAQFMSIRNRYFCTIIEPLENDNYALVSKVSASETEVAIVSNDITIGPGQSIIRNYRIYLGPQELKTISSIKSAWSGVMHYGTFDIISQLLLQLVSLLHGVVRNWGLAIILLSIIIYGVLFPLSIKQMRSMKEMQALQPRIESLRAQHKDNPQKLNKEIMELYKEHKVNPLGGCLPMVLQIPIFFALYQALIRSIALKGAVFLWVKDLSQPDRLFMLPFSIPFLGNEFNLLPLLMVVVMFLQQKLTTPTSGGMSSEQQKLMLILMPVMFLVIFYKMPAGLVLYWSVNSALMLVTQLRINRPK